MRDPTRALQAYTTLCTLFLGYLLVITFFGCFLLPLFFPPAITCSIKLFVTCIAAVVFFPDIRFLFCGLLLIAVLVFSYIQSRRHKLRYILLPALLMTADAVYSAVWFSDSPGVALPGAIFSAIGAALFFSCAILNWNDFSENKSL